ncbi:MAG: hypothetical protein IID54_04120 [Proteobacteria bacterium]|nr:hypothetical protein [Pseudomonadota bacterium]
MKRYLLALMILASPLAAQETYIRTYLGYANQDAIFSAKPEEPEDDAFFSVKTDEVVLIYNEIGKYYQVCVFWDALRGGFIHKDKITLSGQAETFPDSDTPCGDVSE